MVVQGTHDLVALWSALPAAVLRWQPPPAGFGVSDMLYRLSDDLRTQVWLNWCMAAEGGSCAWRNENCRYANQGCCLADRLIPVSLGGGAPTWRMATLFPHWWPSNQSLQLLALGEPACQTLDWAEQQLRARHGLSAAERLSVCELGDLFPRGSPRWRLRTVTPWLVGKSVAQAPAHPDKQAIVRELRKSMLARAKKLSALCAQEDTWQRLVAHLAHHVTGILLQDGLQVGRSAVAADVCLEQSRGNGGRFQAEAWSGELELHLNEALLPWLGLLACCGVGENADKGYGRVELIPL